MGVLIVKDAYGYTHELTDPWNQDFEVELAFLKPWGNQRLHWRKVDAIKSAQKETTRTQLQARGVVRPLPLTIVLTRVASRKLDPSNVPDAMKYVQDEIARWLGYKDDYPPGLDWRYGQQTTKRRRYLAARVTIYTGAITP